MNAIRKELFEDLLRQHNVAVPRKQGEHTITPTCRFTCYYCPTTLFNDWYVYFKEYVILFSCAELSIPQMLEDFVLEFKEKGYSAFEVQEPSAVFKLDV